MQSISSVCVCGAGTMGSGIAQLCAQSGFNVTLYDVDPLMLSSARSRIESNLEKLVEKGKLDGSGKERTFKLLQFSSDVYSCKADCVIEAIVEKPEVKVALFQQLEQINDERCILASNTSSLSITALASAISRKEKLVGLHFFNPAPVMKLVEVVKTRFSSQQVFDEVVDFAKKLDKVVVKCKDAPGFIVNHVARPYYIEALNLVGTSQVDMSTIDDLMESSGFKMGPFRLMDLIGNDVNYAVSCSVYEAMGNPERLKPSSIQKEKVEKGELGRKTKKGYYEY